MIYTSRFSNPELKSGNYAAVRVSVGSPRWKVGYDIVGAIKDLMPAGLRHIEDVNDFRPRYYEQLERVGVDRISEQIAKFELSGKLVVLLCFCDIRKPDWWCHRRVFADWWQEKTGEIIEELIDMSPIKK